MAARRDFLARDPGAAGTRCSGCSTHEREFAAVAKALVRRAPSAVRLVGHGTSDEAASYGVYAFGLLPGRTALRDSISLTVYYGAAIDLSSSAVIALSQSGRTLDVVEYVSVLVTAAR